MSTPPRFTFGSRFYSRGQRTGLNRTLAALKTITVRNIVLPSLACCDLFLNTQSPFLLFGDKNLNQQLPWNRGRSVTNGMLMDQVIHSIIFPYGFWLPRDRSGAQWTTHWDIGAWNHIREFCCCFIIHCCIIILAIRCNR